MMGLAKMCQRGSEIRCHIGGFQIPPCFVLGKRDGGDLGAAVQVNELEFRFEPVEFVTPPSVHPAIIFPIRDWTMEVSFSP